MVCDRTIQPGLRKVTALKECAKAPVLVLLLLGQYLDLVNVGLDIHLDPHWEVRGYTYNIIRAVGTLVPGVHYYSPAPPSILVIARLTDKVLTPTSLSAFLIAICLSSIIREMPQNYNNYIHAFREQNSIHGNQEKSST